MKESRILMCSCKCVGCFEGVENISWSCLALYERHGRVRSKGGHGPGVEDRVHAVEGSASEIIAVGDA